MSAQAQMRALLDQLMGTARDGELPQNASWLVSKNGACAEAGLCVMNRFAWMDLNSTTEGCMKCTNASPTYYSLITVRYECLYPLWLFSWLQVAAFRPIGAISFFRARILHSVLVPREANPLYIVKRWYLLPNIMTFNSGQANYLLIRTTELWHYTCGISNLS